MPCTGPVANDPEIVPELKPLYPEVTLRHFTTMTSGYRARGDDKPPSGYLHGPSGTPFDPMEPLFKPGEKYAYWDSAMNLFGLVLTLLFLGMSIRFAWTRAVQDARRLFFSSIVYLPILWLLMIADRT